MFLKIESEFFFVGIRKDLNFKFSVSKSKKNEKITLQQAIFDLKDSVVPAKEGNKTNKENCKNS